MKTIATAIWVGLIALSLFALPTCKKEKPYNPIDSLPNEQLLSIPTYDGSGQCVHPDIIYFPESYQGSRFLLAYTPYPFSNDKIENPSLAVSQNGVDFTDLRNGLNPLCNAPAYDHNDDPDIHFDPITHKYYLYYLETMRPDSQNVICLESTDWSSFTRHTILHFDLINHDPFILSPAYIALKNDAGHRLYFVAAGDSFKIKSIYSANGTDWSKTAIDELQTDLPPELRPWHVDVLNSPTGYAMLCACLTTPGSLLYQKLLLGTSMDGIHWHFNQKPLMETDPSFHGCRSIYRSTGIWIDDQLAVWYSMMDTNNNWRIGIKKFNTDTL